MKFTLLTTLAAATACGLLTQSASAALTATDSRDSYLAFGTNAAFDPQLSIGESQRPGSGHFNFAIIDFDTSSLTTAGKKYLELSAVEFITLVGGETGPPVATPSNTGSATVNLVSLNLNYANYQGAANKIAWYDANVQSATVPVLGSYNFVNQSTVRVDVTAVVNGWINDGTTNNGFALFSTSGNVELASTRYTADSSLRPSIVTVIPEPSSSALLGLGGLALVCRRRRA